jgi:hypothetical protein
MKNMGFMRRFVMFAAGTAQAGLRDDTLSAMLRCSAISDRSQRLACYDTAPPPVVAGAVPSADEFRGQAVRA